MRGCRSSFEDGQGLKQLLLIVEQLQSKIRVRAQGSELLKCPRRLLVYKLLSFGRVSARFLFEMNYASAAGEALRPRAHIS